MKVGLSIIVASLYDTYLIMFGKSDDAFVHLDFGLIRGSGECDVALSNDVLMIHICLGFPRPLKFEIFSFVFLNFDDLEHLPVDHH